MACEFKAVRELKTGRAYMHPLSLQADQNDPLSWLQRQARAGDVLLAHQDDGVVWGKAHKDGDWVTSDAVLSTSPALKGDCLWSARLFNAQREILLWRDGDGDWRAREIADEVGEGEPAFVEWYDEPQLLWGDHGKHEVVNGVTFTVLEEGAQGLRHAPPIALPFDANGSLGSRNRACLLVRHYLAREDVARVVASRLVRLES
jgi:CRISPR-associated protein (TIGR03984 family)